MMAYRHGFRASELIALRWDQIDLKAGTLHVARLKHGSPSTHPLRGPELRALRAWKREQGDAMPYVFTSLRRGPVTRRTVHHVVAEAAKAAAIEFAVHPHMLRHATGFYLANVGQDTRVLIPGILKVNQIGGLHLRRFDRLQRVELRECRPSCIDALLCICPLDKP